MLPYRLPCARPSARRGGRHGRAGAGPHGVQPRRRPEAGRRGPTVADDGRGAAGPATSRSATPTPRPRCVPIPDAHHGCLRSDAQLPATGGRGARRHRADRRELLGRVHDSMFYDQTSTPPRRSAARSSMRCRRRHRPGHGRHRRQRLPLLHLDDLECLDLGADRPRGRPVPGVQRHGGKRDRLERTASTGSQPRVTHGRSTTIRERAPRPGSCWSATRSCSPTRAPAPTRLPLADGTTTTPCRPQLAAGRGGPRGAASPPGPSTSTCSAPARATTSAPPTRGSPGSDGAQRAMGLHPYPAEQQAVADLVLEQLAKG